MLSLIDLTPEILRRLYEVDNLTETEIAIQYGINQVRVGRLRKKWGIPTRTKGQRITSQLPPLTSEQHQLLIGSLLGDGSMDATSQESARYNEGHCIAQAEYLEWKVNILGPYVSSVFDTTKTDREGKVFHGRGFTTVSCPTLRSYYDLFYPPPDRKKRFPVSLSDEMTPLVLAVWYLDDGRLAHRFHPQITFGLGDITLKRAIKALRKLGFRPEVHGTTSSDTVIAFPGQSDQFFEMVGPLIPECMSYKLPVESARRDRDRNAKELTPDKVKDLYEGGMSFNEIADIYDVGSSTVHRRLKSVGVAARKMGRPRRLFSRTSAEVALANYDSKRWSGLPELEQKQWVEDVYKILSNIEFPFPQHSEQRWEDELRRLSALVIGLKENRIEPWSPVGCGACNPFFPNRFKASAGRSESAFEAWHKADKLRYAIRFQFKVGDPVLPHRVLRAVTMQHRTPSIFRPSVAKFIYQHFCPAGGKVWDPCSGYGGRLLGAYSAGVQYVGTDVEADTVEGNVKLSARLGYNAEIHCVPAEDFIPPKVDLVFTSPPYFDRERYSRSHGQSWLRHGTTITQWVEGFLRPVVRSSYGSLPSGGPLILNIADLTAGKGQVIPLVKMTQDVATEEGFILETTLSMPLAKLNRGDASEPVLVFRKSG